MAAMKTTFLVLLFYWISGVEITMRRGSEGVMAQTAPNVEVTAPLNPVKEGDILSVHCRIRWGSDYSVMILRKTTEKEDVLTSDTIITLQEDKRENRMFIAKRRLKDGSVVFFLSITDVKRSDEAIYKCNVMEGLEVRGFNSVKINVQYFPTEGPSCLSNWPEETINVPERTTLTFNCSSPVGNPPVNVEWIKSGEETTPVQVKFKGDNIVYSELTLRPTMSDNDGIYQCEVRSSVFREDINTCHIGPISVTYNPTTPPPTLLTTTPVPVLTTPYLPTKSPGMSDECKDFCRQEQEPTIFYWTIATVIAGSLAVVFLIMGIIILVKYCMALDSDRSNRGRASRGRPADDVDAGVEFRRDDNRVYMSLDRSGRVQTGEPLYQARGDLIGARYMLTPTRGDDGERQYIVTPTRDRPGTSQTEAVYQPGGVVLERQIFGTPLRGEFERQQYVATSPRDTGECQQYIATPVRGEGDRPQYIATPIRGELGERQPCTVTPGTPLALIRGEVDRQQYITTPKREGERQQYIATPALSEGERQYIVTPTQGGGLERHYLDTPTLPPRRYNRSQYV